MSTKDQVLERLRLVKDEPEENELLFGFEKYAKQLSEFLLDPKTPTPFVFAIHGSWGSGKTSLILQIQKLVQKGINENNLEDWKEIRFDAWEYEKTDVISALLLLIQRKYKDKKGKIESFATSVGLFLTDVALQRGVGIGLDQAKSHFENFIDDIPTIKEKLGELTKDGRLIVFVDDLDRCHIDNILDMLEAIKMFLTAKNVIFVLTVDMKKIERAWRLRYKSEEASIEGLEHIEKIFPIKLSLPPKNLKEIKKYVEKMCSSLSKSEQEIIVNACPPNPRKIKRIINLAYFVLKNLDDDENFDYKVPIVLFWCILTSQHPKLSDIIKEEPHALIQMAIPVALFKDSQELILQRENLSKVLTENENLILPTINVPNKWVYSNTIKGLLYAIDNEPDALDVLRVFGSYYQFQKSIPLTDFNRFDGKMQRVYDDIIPVLEDVIYNSSLIGN